MDFIKSSQKKVDKASRTIKNAMKEQSGRRLAVNFLILSLNLLIIILYFALSQAKIILEPAVEEFKHALTINMAADGQTSGDSITVAGKIASTTAALEQSFPATGIKEVEAPAVGEIVIYNTTTNRQQPLVATTQFVNDAGQIVRLKETVTVNPGQTITAAAYADKAGRTGEVEPGRFQILKLKGARDQIYGLVKERFTGGVKTIRIVSNDDLSRARAEMEQKLKLLGQEKLSAGQDKINSNEININITLYRPSAKAGERAENFIVKTEAEAKIFVFDKEAAKEIIKNNLMKNLPPDKTLIEVDDNSFTAAPDASGQTLNAAITARLLAQLPTSVFDKKAIVGLSREQVKNYFTRQPGVKKVFVEFWPFWVRSVPKSESHIKIEIIKK